jgi:hypothetical protein
MLAWWATTVITPPARMWTTFYGSLAPFDVPAFSGRELAFGAALALVTALLGGLIPAMTAFAQRVARAFDRRPQCRWGILSLRRPTVRGAIVGVEAALAALLVVASGCCSTAFSECGRRRSASSRFAC